MDNGECKFKRNIEQLQRKGIDPKKFWIEKSIEEAREWIKALEDYQECLKHDNPTGTTFEYNLEKETADVANCIEYMIELDLINFLRMQHYQEDKPKDVFPV